MISSVFFRVVSNTKLLSGEMLNSFNLFKIDKILPLSNKTFLWPVQNLSPRTKDKGSAFDP